MRKDAEEIGCRTRGMQEDEKEKEYVRVCRRRSQSWKSKKWVALQP